MKQLMPRLFVGMGVFLLIASYLLGQQMNEHWVINKLVSMFTLAAGSLSVVLGVVTYILVKDEDQDVW